MNKHGWMVVALVGLAARADAAPPGLRIVSMGDSSASGEGNPDREVHDVLWAGTIFDEDDGLDGRLAHSDDECHRSLWSGHRKAADRLSQAGFDVKFKSVACTGAKIENLYGPAQHDDLKNQLEQVLERYAGQRIDALLINIGINDGGFTQAVFTCSLPLVPCTWWEGNPADYMPPVRQGYQNLAQRIRVLADNFGLDVANIYVTGYPNGTTDENNHLCTGIPPWTALFDPLLGITTSESQLASDAIHMLNDTIHDEVASRGADGWHYVDGLNFAGHGFCAGDKRWIRTFNDSMHLQGWFNGTMHPTHEGHDEYARVIGDQLLNELRQPGRPQIGSVGDADKVLRFVVDPKKITIRWRHDGARTSTYQIAYRAAAYSFSGTAGPAPDRVKPDALFDAPREQPRGWTVASVGGDQRSWVHDVTATNDYAVRACTPGACGPWSSAVQVSNVQPSMPAALAPYALGDTTVGFRWQAGGSDPTRTTFQVGHRRRGEVSWQLARTSTLFWIDYLGPDVHDYAVRACAFAICSDWNTIQVSTRLPAPPAGLRIDGPYFGSVYVYSWQDVADNETQQQLALWRTGNDPTSYNVSTVSWSVTSSVTDLLAFSYVRACNDRGCSTWAPVQSAPAGLPLWRRLLSLGPPPIYMYVPPPPPQLAAPARPANAPRPVGAPSTSWPS